MILTIIANFAVFVTAFNSGHYSRNPTVSGFDLASKIPVLQRRIDYRFISDSLQDAIILAEI